MSKTTSRSRMTTSRSPVRDSHVESTRDYSSDRRRDSLPKSSSSYYRPRPRPSSDSPYQEKRGRSRDKFDCHGPPKKGYAYSNKPRYREDSYSKPTTSERNAIERERKALEVVRIAFKKEQEVAA